MLPIYEALSGDFSLDKIRQDELLVVFTGHKGAASAFTKSLREKAVPSLSSHHDYLSLHSGFAEGYQKPFFFVEWKSAGNHPLERRWLLKELKERIRKQFNVKSVCAYIDDSAEQIDAVMAEDLYFVNLKFLDEGNAFENFRIVVKDSGLVASSDLYRQARLKHYFGFRHWINENPDELTSLEIGARLKSFAKEHGSTFEEFDVERLKELGMNLLLAVGQASKRSPSRLFILTHNLKENAAEKPLLLIGKGITFDTGGINLKAFENFVNAMKNDMGGAALVSQLYMALVESGYKKPVILVVPSCENLIAQEAMKPGAVVKSFAGKKVMIEHTDAEGRLILADAIAYAHKHFQPRQTIVAATLTTAALRQFSNFFTPVHFADADFKRRLEEASFTWGERFSFWDEFLPFAHSNKSPAADLTNMGRMPADASIGGGSNVAAHFLKTFASGPFTHIDIFASCWNWSKDYPGAAFGATGAPFNSLFGALRD